VTVHINKSVYIWVVFYVGNIIFTVLPDGLWCLKCQYLLWWEDHRSLEHSHMTNILVILNCYLSDLKNKSKKKIIRIITDTIARIQLLKYYRQILSTWKWTYARMLKVNQWHLHIIQHKNYISRKFMHMFVNNRCKVKQVKFSLCLINEARRHKDVCGSGSIARH
jgi:hypothetical protein